MAQWKNVKIKEAILHFLCIGILGLFCRKSTFLRVKCSVFQEGQTFQWVNIKKSHFLSELFAEVVGFTLRQSHNSKWPQDTTTKAISYVTDCPGRARPKTRPSAQATFLLKQNGFECQGSRFPELS